ncbi:hypothetical protein EJ05DRAFT_243193 [Pseudovirgaria hyperparasitica]|uniref:Uncharacterized protein n=1 Tax=Pseudovirgaria hyperparasitica TaxID=470096 RepID=A0A6A6WFM5_9PEZI|nr:uncharacterized protein EJ05DRAFT_243193 [Pseudovirgaria hyperparasitica]KAF2760810.1 hypothetical protein EJ05DRAFT_243193 [Pseudovirgaria hyperparasitica]
MHWIYSAGRIVTYPPVVSAHDEGWGNLCWCGTCLCGLGGRWEMGSVVIGIVMMGLCVRVCGGVEWQFRVAVDVGVGVDGCVCDVISCASSGITTTNPHHLSIDHNPPSAPLRAQFTPPFPT